MKLRHGRSVFMTSPKQLSPFLAAADTPIVIQLAMGFVADGRLEGAVRAAPVAPLPQNVFRDVSRDGCQEK